MSEEKRYVLTVTDKQLYIIRDACELLARLHLGQFESAVDEVRMWNDNVATGAGWDARAVCPNIKSALFPTLSHNGYFGIRNETVPDRARVAFDIYQIARYRLAWDRWDQKGGDTYAVQFQTPHQLGEEPLADCERLSTEAPDACRTDRRDDL